MVYGFVICAGKQSRFKSETPKALVDFNGTTLLQSNLSAMEKFCDKAFVVCSFENEKFFKCENKIAISSGKGSGDAVWKALEKVEIKKDDTCFVLWGDSLQTEHIFSLLRSKYDGVSLIPCRKEKKPYVQVEQVSDEKIRTYFSKFNEQVSEGFHDLSVFYFNAYELLQNLRLFRKKILGADGNYVHKHNNEMEFMDVFNETQIKAKILECQNYKDFSFNTLEQLNNLIKEVSKPV